MIQKGGNMPKQTNKNQKLNTNFDDKEFMTPDEMRKYKEFLDKKEEKLFEERFKLDVEKQRLSRMRITYNKDVRTQVLIDCVEELKSIFNYKYRVLNPLKTKVSADMLELMFGDFHYKGKVDDKRATRFFETMLSEIKRQYKTGQKLRLSFMGDDIEGELHLNSMDKHQEENTVNQVNGISNHYVDFINAAAKLVPPKMIEIVFTCESNHGQLRFMGLSRGQAPKNDVGYIIRRNIAREIHKDIKMWDTRKKDGVVVTPEAYYMHGDKGFMKSADKVTLTLMREEGGLKGVRDIVMGHWHTFKATRHAKGIYLITTPKATDAHEPYAVDAGYEETEAAFVVVKRIQGRIRTFDVMEVA